MKLPLSLVVVLALILPVSAALTQPWCGAQEIYFSHENVVDPAGYEGLKIYPVGSAQDDEGVTVRNTLGSVLVDSYISDAGLPNVSVIRGGLWRFRTFHYVSLASGVTRFNFSVFTRNVAGNETYLFSALTDDINTLTADEYLTSYATTTDTAMNTTDRFVIKIYASTDHSSNLTAHFIYEGNTNTSHVASPLFVCAETIPDNGSSGGGGESVGLAGGLVAGMVGSLIILRREKE